MIGAKNMHTQVRIGMDPAMEAPPETPFTINCPCGGIKSYDAATMTVRDPHDYNCANPGRYVTAQKLKIDEKWDILEMSVFFEGTLPCMILRMYIFISL